MAAFGKHGVVELFRISKGFTGCRSSLQLYYAPCRFLYNGTALGVDGYTQNRDRVKVQFANMTDKFRSRMQEFCQGDSRNMIFTEDLKNMIHMAESSPEDLDLILKMMLKFNSQNRELRFGNFVFGPVVMRMYFYLNQPDEALKAFKEPGLEGFFDQLVSYQLLMNMLFTSGRFEDVVDVFDMVVSRQTQSARFPRHCVVLAMGALYKMDTPESLQRALKLWNELMESGHNPMRRALTFAAALAVNQGAPHVAIEILSSSRNQNYITIRNLKVMALAAIDRPEDALPILRNLCQSDHPDQRTQTLNEEAIVKLRESINRQDNKEVTMEFQRLEKALVEGQIISHELVDDQLCSEMATPSLSLQPQQNDFRARNRLAASWGQQQHGQQDRYSSNSSQRPWRPRAAMRPGLSELE